jgi:hypothetical protein
MDRLNCLAISLLGQTKGLLFQLTADDPLPSFRNAQSATIDVFFYRFQTYLSVGGHSGPAMPDT